MRLHLFLLTVVLLLSLTDVEGWRRRRRRRCPVVNCSWSGWSLGTCSASCGGGTAPCTSAPSHGTISGSYYYGNRVTFGCHSGYSLRGSSRRTCQANRAWSGTQPRCTRKLCQRLSSPSHGQVTGGHAYGDVTTFTCDTGYELQGDARRTCQANQQWSGAQPTCSRIRCPTLSAPSHGTISGSYYYGNRVTFGCHSGYSLRGSSRRTCQANRAWSGTQPTCTKVQCPTLSAPAHGSSTGATFFGDTLSFVCDTGYELYGSSDSVTCQADQTWSAAAPSCTKIVCPDLSPPLNGHVTGGTEYGDTAVMTCDEGFSLVGDVTRTCQDNKQWSGTQPTCQRKSCPQLSAPDNGGVSGGVLFADTANFTCDPGYELVGSASRLCQANQQWSGTQPSCQTFAGL
ncbi:P-selectin-like [Branchiostoma floridae]|uniref:P-selectin-like n=1 Tax=Branchiostoma floridae TaxID=7739 RepID=A0A9J7M5J2_BRAFL|nr:P-selectin-like [Branchiostoma floridae]